MRSVADRVLPGLFILAVPVLIVTASVTWAVNDMRLYERGFDKYDVSLVTGIDKEGLMASAREIRGYFNSTREPLEVRAEVFGEEAEVFSDREVLHMRDVKRLIWGVYVFGAASLIYLSVFSAVGLHKRRGSFVPVLCRRLLWGSGLTVAIVALVGVGSAVGFDSLFRTFHQLSFSNDLWKLDPRRDYLVMMFPQGFWFDSTLLVGLAAVGGAAVLGSISGGFLALRHRNGRRKGETVPQRPAEAAEL